MHLRFLNHASFVVEHEGTRLLFDPWLYGPAFNDGWDLIAESPFAPEDFAEIDFIWFSHEHPDHFSPRVLLDIPEELRGGITVLYQETNDRKVLGFCEKKGFQTRELASGQRTEIAPGLAVTCERVPLYDSWLFVETPDATLLNLNDAVVHTQRDLDALRSRFGSPDVLLTQFSYAAWRGNRGDTAMRRKDAARKLDIMRRQVRHLRPRYAVPFASFCWFSHEENDFINDSVNTPDDAVQAIEGEGATPVLFYPGDEWQVGEAHDNAPASARWTAAYEGLADRPRRSSSPVPLEELQRLARSYAERIYDKNDRRVLGLLRANPVLPALRPIELHLWDLEQDVRFSFREGLQTIARRTGDYDLRMGSDSLAFLLKQTWGIDTLTVNGRFHADPGGLRRLVTTFGVDLLNNAGIRLSPAFLVDFPNIGFLLKVLLKKLWSLRDQQRG